MAYELPALPYAYDALEPHIDAKTMEIHHTKHHQAYITKANAALEGTEFADLPAEELCARLGELPAETRVLFVTTEADMLIIHFSGRFFIGNTAPVTQLQTAINARSVAWMDLKKHLAMPLQPVLVLDGHGLQKR